MNPANITVYPKNTEEIHYLASQGVKDFVLASAAFSKSGELSLSDVKQMSLALKAKGINAIIEWDTLETQTHFDLRYQQFIKLLSDCETHRVRMQDLGVFHKFLGDARYRIQLNLEWGHRNYDAIQSWLQLSADKNVERFILSAELPRQLLADFLQKIPIPCEVLTLGRILLFYSPRALLAKVFDEQNTDELCYATAHSEESPHRGFLIQQNHNGTLMYHPKDQCLLAHLDDLVEMELAHARLDLRHLENSLEVYWWLFERYLHKKAWQNFKDFKTTGFFDIYPRSTLKGFFQSNKTDALFTKLKNHRLTPVSEHYLGRVIGGKRYGSDEQGTSYVAVLVDGLHPLTKGAKVTFIDPDGKTKSDQLYNLLTCDGQSCQQVRPGELALIASSRFYSPQTRVFFDCET